MKQALLYGTVGGLLIALLKLIEFQHFVRAYPTEVYGGLVAIIFTAVGIYLGLRWTRPKEVVIVKEVRVREEGPFVLNGGQLTELGINPRSPEPCAECKGGASRHPSGVWTSCVSCRGAPASRRLALRRPAAGGGHSKPKPSIARRTSFAQSTLPRPGRGRPPASRRDAGAPHSPP